MQNHRKYYIFKHNERPASNAPAGGMFAAMPDKEKIVTIGEQLWRTFSLWSLQKRVVAAAAVVLLLGLCVCWFLKLWRHWCAEPAEKAERCLRRGQFERALHLWLQANQPLKAAAVAAKLNRCLEAADLYRRGRDFAAAARLYALEGKFLDAAQLYDALGKTQDAARMLERGGAWERALDLYQELKIIPKVEELCQKWGQPQRAADFLAAEVAALLYGRAAEFFEEHREEREKIQKMAAAAATYYRQAGQMPKALAVLERANLVGELAQIYEQLGQWVEAAHFYRQANRPEKAAAMALASRNYEEAIELFASIGREDEVVRVLELSGQKKEAEERRARLNLEQGKLREAAANYAKAGNAEEAASLYLKMHQPAEAAAVYLHHRAPAKAAEIYLALGDLPNAAAAYEAAKQFHQAAACWQKSGNEERRLALLEKAGDFYPLAEQRLTAGQLEPAIAYLQRVPRDHPDYPRAAVRLSRLFLDKGMISLARGKAEEALGGQPLSKENLELYYLMGLISEASKQWAEALAIYEKILLLDYGYADIEARRKKIGQFLSAVSLKSSAGALAKEKGGAPELSPRQVRVGASVLERYLVVKEIGRGGMGTIFLARDQSLDRQVALKVLARDLTGNSENINLFFNEARAAAQLNHPNIVTIHDVSRWGDDYFIIMEYVRGVDLKELLAKAKRLPIQNVILIMKQVAEGLDCAHRRGIFHRDIKNSNLLWAEEKLVKIADFGLAKISRDQALTGGGIKGSPFYMAPEQILGEPVDARTDLYSLGVSIYELLAGIVPFPQGEVAYHHLHTPPAPLAKWRPDTPPALDWAVMKCLAKKPDDRFLRASEIIAVLKPLLEPGTLPV